MLSRFRAKKRVSEKRPPICILGRRVSDKIALCQLAGGFQIGLDIARQLKVRKGQAIWE